MDAHIDQARMHRCFEQEVVAGFLILKGLKVLAKNWTCESGSADVVALDGDTLVFASARIYGSLEMLPEWVATAAEQAYWEQVVKQYLDEHSELSGMEVRFDRVEALATTPGVG